MKAIQRLVDSVERTIGDFRTGPSAGSAGGRQVPETSLFECPDCGTVFIATDKDHCGDCGTGTHRVPSTLDVST